MDIEKDRWIKIQILFNVANNCLQSFKDAFKEYAKILGWKTLIKIVKDLDKEYNYSYNIIKKSGSGYKRVYQIKLTSKTKGFISPVEYYNQYSNLMQIAKELFRVSDYSKKPQFFPIVEVFDPMKPENSEMAMVVMNNLVLKYKLGDRYELLKKNPSLEKFIFRSTIKKDLEGLQLKTGFKEKVLNSKEEIKSRKFFKEQIKRAFNIDID